MKFIYKMKPMEHVRKFNSFLQSFVMYSKQTCLCKRISVDEDPKNSKFLVNLENNDVLKP